MFIRKASIKDVDAIHDLIISNLIEINAHDYSDEVIAYMINYYNPKSIIKWIKDERLFLVAFYNDILAGTVMLDKNEVKGLYVSPAFHGKGIGKKLMAYLEKEVNIKTLQLYASITAFSFYKKIGYITIKQVIDPQMGTAYLMRKTLKPDH